MPHRGELHAAISGAIAGEEHTDTAVPRSEGGEQLDAVSACQGKGGKEEKEKQGQALAINADVDDSGDQVGHESGVGKWVDFGGDGLASESDEFG